MQHLQNHALRIIYWHLPRTDLMTLHTLANIGTLAQRTIRQLLCNLAYSNILQFTKCKQPFLCHATVSFEINGSG